MVVKSVDGSFGEVRLEDHEIEEDEEEWSHNIHCLSKNQSWKKAHAFIKSEPESAKGRTKRKPSINSQFGEIQISAAWIKQSRALSN